MPGLMLHSPADVVRHALTNAGHGVYPASGDETTAWQTYVSKEPHKPDDVLTVYDDVGEDDGRVMKTGVRTSRDGVQVRVRGKRYEEAFVKANRIAQFLDQISLLTVTISASTYRIWSFIREGQPLFQGDEADRDMVVFTINGVAPIRQLS